MQYFVKRGRTYVCPKTHALTQEGCEVTGAVDQSQVWKLQPAVLEPVPQDSKVVKKSQTFDEATAALVAKRDAVTKVRREVRSAEQAGEVKKAEEIAKTVKSDKMKPKKPIQPEDYDEMDEGEET